LESGVGALSMSNRETIRGDVILARYGGVSLLDHRGGRPLGFRSISCWWQDVLGFAMEDMGHWFSHDVSKKSWKSGIYVLLK